jgi:hypothetical protein
MGWISRASAAACSPHGRHAAAPGVAHDFCIWDAIGVGRGDKASPHAMGRHRLRNGDGERLDSAVS